jgi:hypothetical protein
VVLSNTYSAAAYEKGSGIALGLYRSFGEPVQARLPLDHVNAVANSGLDYVEDRYVIPSFDLYAPFRSSYVGSLPMA